MSFYFTPRRTLIKTKHRYLQLMSIFTASARYNRERGSAGVMQKKSNCDQKRLAFSDEMRFGGKELHLSTFLPLPNNAQQILTSQYFSFLSVCYELIYPVQSLIRAMNASIFTLTEEVIKMIVVKLQAYHTTKTSDRSEYLLLILYYSSLNFEMEEITSRKISNHMTSPLQKMHMHCDVISIIIINHRMERSFI